MITPEDIKKLSRLAKIQVSEDEQKVLSKELSTILNYANEVNELNLDGIQPTSHAVSVESVFREDKSKESQVSKNVLERAPDSHNDFFRVPKVI